MKRVSFSFALAVSIVGFACTAGETPNPRAADGPDDSFLPDGKSDTGALTEGTAAAEAVLRVANELDEGVLRDEVGLDRRAAENIVSHRSGEDGVPGTEDDVLFETLAELDAVPYVGLVAFEKLLEYAHAAGYVEYGWRTRLARAREDETRCRVTGDLGATRLRFLLNFDRPNDGGILIFDGKNERVGSHPTPFVGWTQVIEGRSASYSRSFGGRLVNPCGGRATIAVASHVPVVPDDPFGCVMGQVDAAHEEGPYSVRVGRKSVPSSNEFEDGYVYLRWDVPSDGDYRMGFVDDNARLEVLRECGGAEISAESGVRRLRQDESIVIQAENWSRSSRLLAISRPRTETECTDGFDNDGDGLVDCDDPDCCPPPREDCGNGTDDNGNGLVDCFDPDCAKNTFCGANTCPGVDVGSALTEARRPVAVGNSSGGSPAGGELSCYDEDPWRGARFFTWTAPETGTYMFSVTGDSEIQDVGVKVHRECSSAHIFCDHNANRFIRPEPVYATAGTELVLQVGMTRRDPYEVGQFRLRITKE